MDPRDFSPDAPGSLQYVPDGYWAYHPFALPPLYRWSDRLVAALSDADRSITMLRFSAQNVPASYLGLLVRQEAVASCGLAGYDPDIGSFLFMENAFSHAPHLLPASAAAVNALVGAVGAVFHYPVGRMPALAEIRSVHARIWPGPIDPRWPPGSFRVDQTWIGEESEGPQAAEFVPPPPESMLDSLESLLAFIAGNDDVPALIRLAMAHYQFRIIHPYYFANGRTSRMLIPWLLHAWGVLPAVCLPFSRYLLRNRSAYNERINRVSRENAWQDWFIFFLTGVREVADTAIAQIDRLEQHRTQLHARVDSQRTAPRLRHVIDYGLGRGFITVNQVNALFPTGNFKSAARIVERLVALGVLEEITGQVRHRAFRFRIVEEDLSG